MPNYIVERHLPGFDQEKLAAAASLAKITTGKMTTEGTPVRYLLSFFVPSEDKCFRVPLFVRSDVAGCGPAGEQ